MRNTTEEHTTMPADGKWDGPGLRAAVTACSPDAVRAYYTYVDAEGARVPRHSATRIRIEAHYEEARGPLTPLEDAVRELPGCIAAEQVIGDDPNIVKLARARPPCVIATFEEHYVAQPQRGIAPERPAAKPVDIENDEDAATNAVARVLTQAGNNPRDRGRPRAFLVPDLARAVYGEGHPTPRQLALVRRAAKRLVGEGRAQRGLRAGSWAGTSENGNPPPPTSGYSHIDLNHDGVSYRRVPTAADRRVEAEAKAEWKALVKEVGLHEALIILESRSE
jgi:hypothetical protein